MGDANLEDSASDSDDNISFAGSFGDDILVDEAEQDDTTDGPTRAPFGGLPSADFAGMGPLPTPHRTHITQPPYNFESKTWRETPVRPTQPWNFTPHPPPCFPPGGGNHRNMAGKTPGDIFLYLFGRPLEIWAKQTNLYAAYQHRKRCEKLRREGHRRMPYNRWKNLTYHSAIKWVS